MIVELEFDISPELIDAEFRQHLKEDAVFRLIAEQKLSSGRAARILGLDRLVFLELLTQRGIPAIHYTVEDWDMDGRAIEEIERRRADAHCER